MNVKIRPFRPEDTNLVMDTWLRSFFANQSGYREDSKIFFSHHQKQIEKLNNEGKIICQVACLPDDEDIILGFAVFGLDYTLHYIAVKETFKRLGVAKMLLKSFFKDRSEITVSHWTKDVQHIKKVYKVIYNRYRFFQ